jgi:hypothetical protein
MHFRSLVLVGHVLSSLIYLNHVFLSVEKTALLVMDEEDNNKEAKCTHVRMAESAASSGCD